MNNFIEVHRKKIAVSSGKQIFRKGNAHYPLYKILENVFENYMDEKHCFKNTFGNLSYIFFSKSSKF